MSDLGESYRALSEERKMRGAERRESAAASFDKAEMLARRHGLRLRRISDRHYQLRPGSSDWLLNLYPGNGRVYGDRRFLKPPPYLGLEPGWNLLDAVKAAVLVASEAP